MLTCTYTHPTHQCRHNNMYDTETRVFQYECTYNNKLCSIHHIISFQLSKMKSFCAIIFALFLASSQAFVAPQTRSALSSNSLQTSVPSVESLTSTTLNERQWNFNDGRGPFGLKKNAEIWNGRVAQVCFTVVLLQELVTGKGVVEGIQEGNVFNLAMTGITGVSILGLTLFLLLKGKDSEISLEE